MINSKSPLVPDKLWQPIQVAPLLWTFEHVTTVKSCSPVGFTPDSILYTGELLSVMYITKPCHSSGMELYIH